MSILVCVQGPKSISQLSLPLGPFSAFSSASPLLARLSLPPPAGGAWPSWARPPSPPSPPTLASPPPRAGGSPTCSKGQMWVVTPFLKIYIQAAFSSTNINEEGNPCCLNGSFHFQSGLWNRGGWNVQMGKINTGCCMSRQICRVQWFGHFHSFKFSLNWDWEMIVKSLLFSLGPEKDILGHLYLLVLVSV